ncbi:hypothetical protein Aau02nite_37390 [Amorphoplanes auranticolor]|uniref:Uncharacterized protein n=1 Tax=Actinoplanes auranticolor TaxID=47988 RepID=A0A919SBS1_9ACTN|nr:hypothetical protein Aau02nite_37390 [Actinoplanes auranticolor]
MRDETHTLCPLHDTIGPSFVTATGITDSAAMLITTQYGLVADWVHVQHRQVAVRLDPNAEAKLRPLAGNGTTCHDAARQAAVHSPVRVTLLGDDGRSATASRRSTESRR